MKINRVAPNDTNPAIAETRNPVFITNKKVINTMAPILPDKIPLKDSSSSP